MFGNEYDGKRFPAKHGISDLKKRNDKYWQCYSYIFKLFVEECVHCYHNWKVLKTYVKALKYNLHSVEHDAV